MQVTSIYLHSSDAPVSALIDLSTSMEDGETIDESITYVKTETSKKSRAKSKSKNQEQKARAKIKSKKEKVRKQTIEFHFKQS